VGALRERGAERGRFDVVLVAASAAALCGQAYYAWRLLVAVA
jgi:hypothetical protein